jgi:NADP-reducing hydrogenase subunit HndB
MRKLSVEDLDKISQRVRKTTLLREGAGRAKITVHMGTCGIAAGARKIMNTILDELDKKNIDDVTAQGVLDYAIGNQWLQ